MPVYHYKNTETDEVEEHVVSMADKDEFEETNPHLEQVFLKVNMITGARSARAMSDEGWKDRLRAIKKANPGSTINV